MWEQALDLFIIHSFQHPEDYLNLITLLATTTTLRYRNHSATPEQNVVEDGAMINDEDLAVRLLERIEQSQLILLIAGSYLTESKWMQYELATAAKLHKSILALVPEHTATIPSLVFHYSDHVLPWKNTRLQGVLQTITFQDKSLA